MPCSVLSGYVSAAEIIIGLMALLHTATFIPVYVYILLPHNGSGTFQYTSYPNCVWFISVCRPPLLAIKAPTYLKIIIRSICFNFLLAA